MRSFQEVANKVAEVPTLAAGVLARAAAGLVNTSESFTLDKMSRGLDRALRALIGDEVSAVTTSQETWLQIDQGLAQEKSLRIAQKIVDSYVFDRKTGVSTFMVPAEVTDVEAMKALNVYFRKNVPTFRGDVHYASIQRDAVYAEDLNWYDNLPLPASERARNYSDAREITIIAVVERTKGKNTEDIILDIFQKTLVSSDPRTYLLASDVRDMALAAAIHACKHQGEDLFQGWWVYGCRNFHVLRTCPNRGVIVVSDHQAPDNHRAGSVTLSHER